MEKLRIFWILTSIQDRFEDRREETLKLFKIKYVLERKTLPSLRGIKRILKKTENKKLIDKTGDIYQRTYLKAMPLNDLSDLDIVKREVSSGKVLILRVTPLAEVSIEDVKFAVNELCKFTKSIDGDIARLGEERVVICPPNVKIWREKTTISNEAMPTAV